jgi:hypothetical protein
VPLRKKASLSIQKTYGSLPAGKIDGSSAAAIASPASRLRATSTASRSAVRRISRWPSLLFTSARSNSATTVPRVGTRTMIVTVGTFFPRARRNGPATSGR